MKILRLAAILIFLASPAFAGALDDARSAGWLGERPDGYVGLADPNAPDSAKALMKDVNRKRRDLFEQRAAAAGVSLSAYQAIAAKEIYESLPSGVPVMGEGGSWTKKP